jgi:hypothetical protein
MPLALAPHAPVSLRRFPMPVAARFSRDGARENVVIQSQLVEISAVFGAGGGGEKWGDLFAGLGGDAFGFIHPPSGLARGGSLAKPCRFACSGVQKKKAAADPRSPSARQAQGERFNRKPVLGCAFRLPIAACFSREGACENRVIQSQLVEISAVFAAGVGGSPPSTHPNSVTPAKAGVYL